MNTNESLSSTTSPIITNHLLTLLHIPKVVRSLSAAQQEEILSRFHLAPNRIVSALQQEHNITFTPHNVYNVQGKERRRLLNGRPLISALLDGLEAGNLDAPFHTHFDTEQWLPHLLIVSLSVKEICCKYSVEGIWLIDAAYKTNQLGLPLMHVVGVTVDYFDSKMNLRVTFHPHCRKSFWLQSV